MNLFERKPTIPEVLPAVNDYYRRVINDEMPNGNGGCLHIVLEDGNVHDSHVRDCLRTAVDNRDLEGLLLCLVLLEMSPTQRLKLSNKHEYPTYEDYKKARII